MKFWSISFLLFYISSILLLPFPSHSSPFYLSSFLLYLLYLFSLLLLPYSLQCCSRDPEFIGPGLQSLCSLLSLHTIEIKDEEENNIIKGEKIGNENDIEATGKKEISSTSTSTSLSANYARDRSIRLVVAQCITRLCRSQGEIEYPPLVRSPDM